MSSVPPLLSAVMIVRDEEHRLGRCLRSVASVVDEIVVVDTGSSDATISVAEAHGCVIEEIPWPGDFAAARNVSLDLASGRWVLMIDADEVLAPVDRPDAEDILTDDPAAVALTVGWRGRPGTTPAREVRLWRNRPDIRFRGRIHENVMADLGVILEGGSTRIGSTRLLIEHDGYEGDQSAKFARDLPLLDAEIRDGDDRPYLHHHRGRILWALGREREATDAWGRGADLAMGTGRHRAEDGGCHAALVGTAAAGDDLLPVAVEALEAFDFGFVAWECLQFGERAGVDDLVLRCADRLIAGPRSEDLDVGVDPRIWDEWPFAARGRVRLRHGDARGALADFDRARRADPSNAEYRVLHQAAEVLARRTACD